MSTFEVSIRYDVNQTTQRAQRVAAPTAALGEGSPQSKWLDQKEAMEFMLKNGYHCDFIPRYGIFHDGVCCAPINNNNDNEHANTQSNRICDYHIGSKLELDEASHYFKAGYKLARQQIDNEQAREILNQYLPKILSELIIPSINVRLDYGKQYNHIDHSNNLYRLYLDLEEYKHCLFRTEEC
jgi:hypothetical protein